MYHKCTHDTHRRKLAGISPRRVQNAKIAREKCTVEPNLAYLDTYVSSHLEIYEPLGN